MRRHCVLVVALCGALRVEAQAPASGTDTSIPLRQLAVRAPFPYTAQRPGTAVLPDSASWAEWMRRTRAHAPSVGVNWRREAVVAVVTREYVDGPTVVTFERARLRDDTLVVEYRLSFPAQRYDYGSQECAAAAIERKYLERRVVSFRQLTSKGAPASLAPRPPRKRKAAEDTASAAAAFAPLVSAPSASWSVRHS